MNGVLSLLFGINLTAYIGHKSFGIIFFGVLFGTFEILIRLIFRQSLLSLIKRIQWRWALIPMIFFLLPHLYRTYYYTGDPFFPVIASQTKTECRHPEAFKVRLCEDNDLEAKWQFKVTNLYGWGHDVAGFFKNWLFLAIPARPLARQGFFFGQNKNDYPIGIFWYFTWLLIIYVMFRRPKNRKAALLALGMALSFYAIWFLGSQQSRWLYPDVLILALFGGYALSHLNDLKKWQNPVTLTLIMVLIAGVSVNSLKIIIAQQSNFTCLGSSCLHFQENLYSDYQHRCTLDETISMPGRDHLGYLTCLVTTPREDFPWLKKIN